MESFNRRSAGTLPSNKIESVGDVRPRILVLHIIWIGKYPLSSKSVATVSVLTSQQE